MNKFEFNKKDHRLYRLDSRKNICLFLSVPDCRVSGNIFIPGLNPQTKHYLDSSEYFWKAFREGKLKALKVGEGKQAVYRISRHDLNEWHKLKGGFRY